MRSVFKHLCNRASIHQSWGEINFRKVVVLQLKNKFVFQATITIRDSIMVLYNKTESLCSKREKRNELGIVMTIGSGIKCDTVKEVNCFKPDLNYRNNFLILLLGFILWQQHENPQVIAIITENDQTCCEEWTKNKKCR